MSKEYKEAGVDIQKSDIFVNYIKKRQQSSKAKKGRVKNSLGGYASLYDLGGSSYLAQTTDGVGTKLKLAKDIGRYKNLGQDLVAMSVNDLICCGATPLTFLDYLSFSKLEFSICAEIFDGIFESCEDINVSLVGGETAEMPDVYTKGEFDLAGFCSGIVKKSELITGDRIQAGDKLIGLRSSGFHSNGLSLIRKVLEENDRELKRELLTPTKIYVEVFQKLQKVFGNSVKGACHITGGGLSNINRILEGKNLNIELTNLPKIEFLPEIMQIIFKRLKMEYNELAKIFNMGLGFVICVDAYMHDEIIQGLKSWGEDPIPNLGELKASLL